MRESFVRLHAPLPAESAPHPAACDYITYLRFRHRRGPRRATDAHAVVVLIPGLLGGAKSFDQLARNTVRNAGAKKRRIEVWVLDRRANCLEDHHGVKAGARAKSIQPAFDYYFGGGEVEGRRFPGFVPARGRKVPRGLRARPHRARLAHGADARVPEPAPRARSAWSAAATRSAARSRRRSRAGTSTATPTPTATRATTSARRSSVSTPRSTSAPSGSGTPAGSGVITGAAGTRRAVPQRAAAHPRDDAAHEHRGGGRVLHAGPGVELQPADPAHAGARDDAAPPLLA